MDELSSDSHSALRIRPLAREDAEFVARLHIQGQPGTFLTQLGPAVLTEIYRAVPIAGFGFVAENPSRPVGFVSGATGIGSLIMPLLRQERGRAALRLTGALLARFGRNPVLLRYSLETLLYPLRTGQSHAATTDAPPAREQSHTHGKLELLSIMVEPAQRGHGIGSRLMARFVGECHARGATLIEVTVDAQNAGARRFYADHYFCERREFRLYGRAMCLFERRLT